MKTALALLILLTTAPAAAETAKSYGDRLAKLDELNRFAVLRRSINNNSLYCKRVTAAMRQGPYNNLEMWSVRCTPGGDFGVFLGPDGSVQASKCGEHAQLKMPPCRLPKK